MAVKGERLITSGVLLQAMNSLRRPYHAHILRSHVKSEGLSLGIR